MCVVKQGTYKLRWNLICCRCFGLYKYVPEKAFLYVYLPYILAYNSTRVWVEFKNIEKNMSKMSWLIREYIRHGVIFYLKPQSSPINVLIVLIWKNKNSTLPKGFYVPWHKVSISSTTMSANICKSFFSVSPFPQQIKYTILRKNLRINHQDRKIYWPRLKKDCDSSKQVIFGRFINKKGLTIRLQLLEKIGLSPKPTQHAKIRFLLLGHGVL